MKKYLFILLFTPISGLSQNPFPMIEYFPFTHDIFSTPIQLNSLNLFTPRINPTCPIQGKASTYYNFYSFQIGDTLSEYSSYTPYFPNSFDSENLDSMSASGFINGIQVDFGNAETSFSMAGSISSPSRTYVFDNNGRYNGKVEEWYVNGQKLREFNYTEGLENGKQKLWDLDGNIKANYEVINGERYGLIGLKKCFTVIETE